VAKKGGWGWLIVVCGWEWLIVDGRLRGG